MAYTPDPAAVGDIYLVTMRASLFSQLILNTFYYRIDALQVAGSTTNKQVILNGFLTAANGFRDKFLACLPTQYQLESMDIQKVSPYRTIKQVFTDVAIGTNGLDVLSANHAMSIERFGPFAKRSNVGAVRLVGTDDPTWTVNGALTFLAGTALTGFAAQMEAVQGTVGATDVFAPVLYRPGSGTAIFDYIIGATPQLTARVVRRRTVGVGK